MMTQILSVIRSANKHVFHINLLMIPRTLLSQLMASACFQMERTFKHNLQIAMDPPDVLYRPVDDLLGSDEDDQADASAQSASDFSTTSAFGNSTTELLTSTTGVTSTTANWTTSSEQEKYQSTAIQRLLPVILIIIIVIICALFAIWSYIKSQKRSGGQHRTRYGLVRSSVPSEQGTDESLRTVPSSGIRSGKKSKRPQPVTVVVDR